MRRRGNEVVKIIDIIKRENKEREDIINAIEAREKAWSELPEEERKIITDAIAEHDAKAWDFLNEKKGE
jgi:vacuolar-type H+-ATPase subunit H